MAISSAAIIASNNPDQIKNCLQYINNQTVPFTRIIVVAWGKNLNKVKDSALSVNKAIEIVDPDIDTRLETNRNKAMSFLSEAPPDRIAFFDDDTFIDNKWHEEMQAAANEHGNLIAFSTVTRHLNDESLIQSAGHILKDTKPLDLAYNQKFGELKIMMEPLCPCGNSAFIPWSGIERIQKKDSQVWDPDFEQWQTCFDFGLKLKLCGINSKLVRKAYAYHNGYLNKSLKNYKLSEHDVIKQLRSRFLIYGKFFPKNEYEYALKVLNSSLDKWLQIGYPHSELYIKGSIIKKLFNEAKEKAEVLLDRKKPFIWKEGANTLDSQTLQKIFY